ncbi:MAG: hypothetical protein VW338_05035 [Rhodospirillaceae bacterium]
MFKHHMIPVDGIARVGLSVPESVTEDATGNIYKIERGHADAAGNHRLELVREFIEHREWDHEVQVGWTDPEPPPPKPDDWPADEPWEPATPPPQPIYETQHAEQDVKRIERRELVYSDAAPPAGWTFAHPTPAEIVGGWSASLQARVTGPGRRIEKTDIPGHAEYRDCWRDTGAAIVEDMPTARTIHMGFIRAERDAELGRLDQLELQYLGNPARAAELAEVRAEKQTLRDIPQTFDLSGASTVDELKALWPAGLTK